MIAIKLTRFARRRGSHKVAGEVALRRRTGLLLNMMSLESSLCQR